MILQPIRSHSYGVKDKQREHKGPDYEHCRTWKQKFPKEKPNKYVRYFGTRGLVKAQAGPARLLRRQRRVDLLPMGNNRFYSGLNQQIANVPSIFHVLTPLHHRH